MNFETEIYKGKSFSSLLKDIYQNSKSKEVELKELIGELKGMVNEIGDAVILVPLLKTYLELAIKNDESLIKMAAIVQKALTVSQKEDPDSGELLSDRDKEQLFAEIRNIQEVKKLPTLIAVNKTD